MRPPKFRNGDIVYTFRREKVRILRSYGKNGDIVYETEEVNGGLKDEYSEHSLSFTDDFDIPSKNKMKNYIPSEKVCPKCGNSWSITGFGAKKWYDCRICKKTAEELCKGYGPPAFNSKNYDIW